ncbi:MULTISPECIES: S-layer protein [unclassified Variovorax]|uniref:S-layer protein n=1 Tax=unclassified Variovorax TaxID=663243 RepID=UPI000D133167|nr:MULTISPECIES: S-layer protein [unclassified Variovorax]AVQ85294.1 S-layer protein [Variovorax sp. PMC12]QRY34918.1 S-layer protein [Variovorax sp. PDNC026]
MSYRFSIAPPFRRTLFSTLAIGTLMLAGCGGGSDAPGFVPLPTATAPAPAPSPAPAPAPAPAAGPTGRWTIGDLHIHTMQSDDAQQVNKLDQVLAQAFDRFGLDWAALSDHLRMSSYDNDGNKLATAIPFSEGMAKYQVPRIKALQAAGKYADKTIFASFEWDMPSHDHGNVGLLTDNPMSATALKAANQFEYLFTNRPASAFAPEDVAAWGPKAGTGYNTHAETLAAIAWLKSNYPDTSYLQINHPSRNPGKYTIAQLREMNDLAPNIVFSLEGMVGNQMEPDRGGYTSDYIPANLPSRVYGGVDYLVAKLGGTWDALLSEGRHIWNVADSDYHFTISQGQYSSGYAPGEYAKNHLWGDIKDPKSLLAAMRSGKLFAVNGDLINALDFKVQSAKGAGEMGSEVAAKAGEDLKITIRFKSPERNNFEYQLGSGVFANVKPAVDHIDLIAGDVTGLEKPGTPGYSRDTNTSTRVLKRFTRNDWKLDADGYFAVSYTVKAGNNQYFRLRGTNLGTDVPGETAAGEPLPDAKVVVTDNVARFNAINARNYADLWFYSNPVFVKVAAQ